MNKQIIKDELTGESYVKIRHDSGLEILVCEMPGYTTTEAFFGTRYGSVNTRFKTAADSDFTVVPEGIAHFLEHKLFENEECDVFSLFAKTGASANAYTSFERTCYLFSCSENYKESLEILLSFVQEPYFTQETVDKEQGIIAQEIRMCNDNPGTRGFYNMLRCIYHNHPVKIDIAGTEESIKKIDADLLYKCYNTFYNLHNMVLVVAGNVKVDEVLEIADRKLRKCEDVKLQTAFLDEPETIVKKECIEKMAVGKPIFNIGFKSTPCSGYEGMKAELEAFTALSIITNPASEFSKGLMDEGLINTSFSNEVFTGDGFFTSIICGESNDPHEVRDRILKEIACVKAEGLDRSLFENIRKYTYGSAIKDLENPESVASILLNSFYLKTEAFDGLRAIREMTYEDVMNTLNTRFDPEKSVISIIAPK